MSMENKEGPEKFSFLQEVIKEKPLNRKKLMHKAVGLAAAGILFGAFASISFCVFQPWVDEQLNAEEEITIPKDEEPEEHPQEAKAEEEEREPELTLENFKELERAMYQVAAEANKSIVSVTSAGEDDNWAEEERKEGTGACGVIMPSNSREYLILTMGSAIKDAEQIQVTFGDGVSYDAGSQKEGVRCWGLQCLRLIGIRSVTAQRIRSRRLVLGNSNMTYKGDVVIALGSLFGYSKGMGYGIISSNKNTVSVADRVYRLLDTDIPASRQGSGVLFNIDGEVIGFTFAAEQVTDESSTLRVLAVSDVKEELEKLLNGNSVPYIGIVGTNVTDEIAEAQKLPKGIYVKEIEADSPGMAAGVQCGDIITAMDGDPVVTVKALHNKLLTFQPGDEVKLSAKRLGSEGYVEISYTVVIGGAEKK